MELPSTLTEIGDFAFYNASNMKELTIHADRNNVLLGKKWEPSATGRPIDTQIIWTREN